MTHYNVSRSLRQPVPDVPVDTILLDLVEDLVPPAVVEVVVELAMTVVHVAGDETLNGGGLAADGVLGPGDDQDREVDRYP